MRLFDSSYPLIALSPQPSSSGAATEPWLCNKVRSCPAIKRKASTSLTPETLRLTASAHATGFSRYPTSYCEIDNAGNKDAFLGSSGHRRPLPLKATSLLTRNIITPGSLSSRKSQA